MQFEGRRELFPLNTAVKVDAAKKAKNIWASLITVGWDATLRKYKPQAVYIPPTFTTIGDYVSFLELNNFYPPKTLYRNLTKVYTALSSIFEFEKTRTRFDARNSGLKNWRVKIRAIRWDSITPHRIEKWKNDYLAARSGDPARLLKAKHTLDSYIRAMKALVGPRIRSRLASYNVVLPEPIPFANVSFVSRGRSAYRYRSRIDPLALTAAALTELQGERLEELKVFLLALHLGLRRNEIDKLTWGQFDFARGVLQVESTEYIQLKTEGSECDIVLEPGLAAFFKRAKENATGIFVIESKCLPRKNSICDHYRANNVFDKLIVWLREKGITAQKPLHTLRKEFGRLITEKMGIYAASLALRHASTQVTMIYYADDTRPKHTGLGALIPMTSDQAAVSPKTA
jgi:integrase